MRIIFICAVVIANLAVSLSSAGSSTYVRLLFGMQEWDASWNDDLGDHVGNNKYTSTESDIVYFNIDNFYEDILADIRKEFDYHDAKGVQTHVTLSESTGPENEVNY